MLIVEEPIPKVFISSPGVGPHIRNNVESLFEAGYLSGFATSFVDHPGSWLARSLKTIPGLSKNVSRRISPNVPWEFIATKPFGEVIRSLCSTVLSSPYLTHLAWQYFQPRFDSWASQRIGDADIAYIYEQCGEKTAEVAKALGRFVFVEQISQHHRYLKDVLKTIPQSGDSKERERAIQLCEDSAAWNIARDRELALADAVFCNSEFTRRTLIAAGTDETRIHTIPLGCPKVVTRNPPGSRVIFLHAGTESYRKGTSLLYETWRKIADRYPQSELWFAGSRSFEGELGLDLPGRVTRFGSLPQSELLVKMSQASVLVMPTLADGFGMVIAEGLSRGLPVITTDSAGASDLLVSGHAGGLVIPAGNADALVDAMAWCAENPRQLNEIGLAGQEIAENWQWEHYRYSYSQKIASVYTKLRAGSIVAKHSAT